MKFILTFLFSLWIVFSSFGQEKKSKGDNLYFGYAYTSAIAAYKKEMQKKPLATYQLLHLADAYIKTGDYKNAANTYLDFYKKDTLMPMHDFNNMLRALKSTSGMDRVKAFLATKTDILSKDLLENAAFNAELLETNAQDSVDIQIFNIDNNTAQSDFSPSFYGDRLLFTSDRVNKEKETYKPSGSAYLDIYLARVEPDGNVKSAVPFSGIPKSPFHKATPFYSGSLDHIFYVLSNADGDKLSFDPKGKNALAMGISDGKGSFEYLFRDLSTSFYYPFYEAETSKLYFAANFSDSYGGTDLYFVYTNEGQIMSAPVNLGPRINTPGNEIAPYLFENSLYFSSDVFYGLGGMDIYETKIQPDGDYSIPVNLGDGINSDQDDFGWIIKNKIDGGLMGYFSSNRIGGKGKDDIYAFHVSEKPGLKTLLLKGRVVDSGNNREISDVAIRILGENNRLIKEVYTNENGEFRLEIPGRDVVTVVVARERYSEFEKTYSGVALEGLEEELALVELTFLDDLVHLKEDQMVIKLGKFYFGKGRSQITPEIANELDKVVFAIKKFPELQLGIATHTDSRGSNANNLKLSQDRSDAIKQYLIQNGVPQKNILEAVGYGEEKILNNCTDGKFCLDMLHKQNERSLIEVLNYDELFSKGL